MPCSCCTSESLDIFGEKGARRELRRYLRKGLGGADARLIAAWAAEGELEGATVIEVGGGIGQIQVDLLRRGAMRGTVVEVLGDYRGPAGELAAAAGVADRSSFVLADLIETPDAVERADVVVLRRVVCCSPDGPELLAAAAGRTRRDAVRQLSARSPCRPRRSPTAEHRARAGAEAVPSLRPCARGPTEIRCAARPRPGSRLAGHRLGDGAVRRHVLTDS